ncbi:conjugal transfer protein TraC [Parafrankia colletiae]|uniref:Conjugal transfer protein TraC n=1 Tax=Parafrankia colletiae TaxID=573497 RepID=A0A1S1QDB0_9ACTN|nr:conjugal transfer protein TraC [Parafrankia colletiae]MCK9903611.1 conjugal transfer protein TraC [Frankia sp. Cpl3]OHV31637.1 conjugal transfer protein TraC [Parafrankia colletiae]
MNRRNRLRVAAQGAPSRSRRPLVPGRGQGAGQLLPVEGPALFTPPALVVDAGQIEVSGLCATTISVVGYPREVGPGWMEPLLAYPGRLDVALHVDPTPPAVAALRLRRQLGRLESGRRADAAAGRLADPELDAAAADAGELARQVARGEARLFRVGLYLTVYADTRDQLAEEAARVTALAHSLLLTVRRARYRTVQGWVSTLPLGLDLLQIRRAFDTQALAAGIPFTTPDLPLPDPQRPGAAPVVYGTNLHSAGLVAHDRWAQPNYNSVTTGASGAGKSFVMKLDVLRSQYQGVEVAVVDPEDEYGRLAAAVGGTRLALGAPGVHLNPLDLPAHSRHDPDLLTRRALFCHTLISTLLADAADDHGGLGAGGRAVLDAALLTAYRQAGITHDPDTWTRPAPLLADVAAALSAAEDPAGPALAARLAPFVTGSHAGLFAHPTTTQPTGHLVVYSLRALPDELKAAGTLLTLDAIWRTVADPTKRRRRLVVVDEGWLLMAHPAGAKFLFRLAKAARKHWAGLAVVTQDSADLLGSELGRAVVANSSTQILLRQDPSVIDDLRRVYKLTDGEATQLLTAGPGDALLLTGTGQRTALHTLASPAEYALITTDPTESTTITTAPGDAGPLDEAWPQDTAGAETGLGGAPRRPAVRRPVDDDADPF